MDTTRLDVFALDPVTLRWVQAELTIGMDWYTRCVTGIRVTPVSVSRWMPRRWCIRRIGPSRRVRVGRCTRCGPSTASRSVLIDVQTQSRDR